MEQAERLIEDGDMTVAFMHLKVAGDWVTRMYSDADEFGQVEDLYVEAVQMFEEWGLGQNRQMNINSMIDALSFVRTYRDKYFD